MKKILLSGLAVLIGATLMLALDESALQTKMKALGKASKAGGKAAADGDMDAVAMNAKAIAEAFDGTESFWADKKMDDAVQWTKDGMAAAKALGAAAAAKDADAVRAAQGKVGASCKQCHTAHREQVSQGVYKIK